MIKPTPSISKEQKTVNENNQEVKIKINGRHDPCIAIRVIPVINSMVALSLLDLIGDSRLVEPKEKLEVLRDDISEIDKNIFLLLDERFNIVKKIIKYKKKKNIAIENKNIEQNLINKIQKLELKNLTNDFIKKLYNKIFNESKRIQKDD